MLLMHIVSFDSRENIPSAVVGARRVFACRTVHTKAQCLQPHCMSLEFAGGEGSFAAGCTLVISFVFFCLLAVYLVLSKPTHKGDT